jgi:hypothetical protein
MTVKTLVITGVTSTQLIANYPPASNAGRQALTSDMNLMMCDGVRWLVTGTPPIPAGAHMFGYGKNLYTCFPVLADIGNWAGTGSSNNNGAYRLYNGYQNYSTVPDATAYQQDSVTMQLQLLYQGNGSTGNGILTTWPRHNAAAYASYGMLPTFQPGRGFYVEAAITMSSNATDCFNAYFLEPIEHNTINSDENSAFSTPWRQWPEFDVYEAGHGTDHSGNLRGSYLQWSAGLSSTVYGLTAAPSGTITSLPALSAPWAGETGNFTISLGTSGQSFNVNFTAGSTATTCSSTTITGSPAANFTLSANGNTLVSNPITNTTSFDATVEHIYGLNYDPVGQTVNVFVDNTLLGSLSTYNPNSSNAFRDALHMGQLFQMASHGTPYTPTTMNLRYFSAWVP